MLVNILKVAGVNQLNKKQQIGVKGGNHQDTYNGLGSTGEGPNGGFGILAPGGNCYGGTTRNQCK